MHQVARRDTNTLLNTIKLHTRPSSTIILDCWPAYRDINHLVTEEGYICYEHATVNHSTNFVDPTTGASTNGIASTNGPLGSL